MYFLSIKYQRHGIFLLLLVTFSNINTCDIVIFNYLIVTFVSKTYLYIVTFLSKNTYTIEFLLKKVTIHSNFHLKKLPYHSNFFGFTCNYTHIIVFFYYYT